MQFDAGQWNLVVGITAVAATVGIALMEGSRLQATPAKLILGLNVGDEETGKPIGFWRDLWRRLVLAPAIWLLGIGVLAILRSPRRQGWHDRKCGAVPHPHPR
jgi:uncharacterized RDD family membrane protein YckC